MNKILEEKYPYLSNFFKTAIGQNRLFHSLIFYGSNIYAQYLMALELARQLNCLEDGREDCNCRNCKWIRENKHPAVMTISKIDNKTDSSKTVISEEQVNMVLDTLVNSSDYHRVYIFCNADMKELSRCEEECYAEFKSSGFNPPQEANDEKIWYPSGINTSCFSTVAANAMLKSIEEPSSGITFIFLTSNKEDLLQTIISRSQAFYLPDKKTENYNTDFLQKYFVSYPLFKKENALSFAQSLLNYQIDNNLEPEYVIDCIQAYLLQLALANSNNKSIINKIFSDIEKTQKSKQMLKAYIKEQTVYEDFVFYLAKRM